MFKFIILCILYLNICLTLNCNGRVVNVEVKIRDDWEGKREFIYLKNVEEKERFVLIKKLDTRNKLDDNLYSNPKLFNQLEFNPDKNVFNVKINNTSKYISQLKRKILIGIENNGIIQKILPELEKQVFYIRILSLH